MADSHEQAPPILSHVVSLRDGVDPLTGRIEANEKQRAELAALLGLENLGSLSFDYRLDPAADDRYRLTGKLDARLTQLCVITLDPVAEHVEEQIAVECWPEEQIEAGDEEAEADVDIGELPDDPPVPIIGGKIDLGAFAAEILASAINPYPRREDAEFKWDDPKAAASASGPFAGLMKWKTKR